MVVFPTARDQWCDPTRAGKATNKPSVPRAVLVKIVTEILFWQCAFGEPRNNRLGSRSQTSALRKNRDRDTYMRKREQNYRGKKWVRALYLGDLGG